MFKSIISFLVKLLLLLVLLDLGLRAVYVVLVVLAGSRCWPRS